MFLAGSAVVLLVGNVPACFVGRLLRGVGTMLVAALPQLVTGRRPRFAGSVAIINVGLFGATSWVP